MTFSHQAPKALLLCTVLALSSAVQAQVSLYSYSQAGSTYTEITEADGGYQLGTPAFFPPSSNLTVYADPADPDGQFSLGGYLTPILGPGYPIGFDFTYNGEVFDRIGISTGGWISFGKSEDGDEAVWIFTSDHPAGRPLYHSYNSPVPSYKRNRIAGFANSELRPQDQSSVGGPTSSFRMATIGTAPNRVCVIQWEDFRAGYSVDGNLLNFQIRLNESTNIVEVAFGPMVWGYAGAGSRQVGLGGRVNTDYNNRMTVPEEPLFAHDWNNTLAGTSNTSACVAGIPDAPQSSGPGIYPVPGLTYRWTPPACPPPGWPVEVSDITYNSAIVNWSYPPASVAFDYVIATIEDPNDPAAVTVGSTEEVSLFVEGLEPLTTYYVYVRSDCGGEPGPWSSPTPFRTEGGGVLECGAAALQQTYCHRTGEQVMWFFSTSDGSSPVRFLLTEGSLGSGNTLKIFDGPDTTGTLLFNSMVSAIPGQVVTALSGSLTMKLRAFSAGSCEDTEWIEELAWTVGCLDCTAPLSTYAVVNQDCETLTYDVQLQLVSLGSASSVIINNDQGVAPTTVSTTGTYVVGPFTAGTPVTITVENPVNDLCNVSSVELLNAPCAIVDCGPTDYAYCYQNNDNAQWLYQGQDAPLGIRFRRGSTFGTDRVSIYNGSDPFSSPAEQFSGDLANRLATVDNAANELLFEVDADGILSCEDGYATEWDYVVACYDDCTQPIASFTTACVSNTQYNVTVTISEIGSSGSVNITNDGGAPTVVATAAGTYTVGPFASASTVNIEVEGASVLCSWTAPTQFRDCTGVGVEELHAYTLQLYPNPSEGRFRLDLPAAIYGAIDLRILDLQGRALAWSGGVQADGRTFDLDLSALPSGAYMVIVNSDHTVYTGKVQVVH